MHRGMHKTHILTTSCCLVAFLDNFCFFWSFVCIRELFWSMFVSMAANMDQNGQHENHNGLLPVQGISSFACRDFTDHICTPVCLITWKMHEKKLDPLRTFDYTAALSKYKRISWYHQYVGSSWIKTSQTPLWTYLTQTDRDAKDSGKKNICGVNIKLVPTYNLGVHLNSWKKLDWSLNRHALYKKGICPVKRHTMRTLGYILSHCPVTFKLNNNLKDNC